MGLLSRFIEQNASHAVLTSAGENLSAADMAMRRKLWRESPAYARRRRLLWGFAAGIPVVVAIGVLGAYAYWSSSDVRANLDLGDIGPAVGFAIYIYGAFVAVAYQLMNSNMKRQFRDDLLLGELESGVLKAEESAADEGADIKFASLWFATQRRLDYYHQIATGQARQSFLNAQIAAGLGFLVLIISAIVAGVANSASASIVAGATGVFGAALGGYMGTTFVRMQQDASTRLRAYFLQPLEFSRILAAERLAETLEGSARDAALLSIIRSVAGSPAISEGETPGDQASNAPNAG